MLVRPTRPRRYFYMRGANMNWSFDTLAEYAEKFLGAEPEVGDILIADNAKGDKRKVLQFTTKGWMIYYARLHIEKFVELADHNGKINKPKKEIL